MSSSTIPSSVLLQAAQLSQNVENLQAASKSKIGLRLDRGHLVPYQGKTSREAAQKVTGMVQKVFEETRNIGLLASQRGSFLEEDKLAISMLSTNLEHIEQSLDGFELSLDSKTDLAAFDAEVRNWIRNAKEQLRAIALSAAPKAIQETLPDTAVVDRRLLETKLVRNNPRKDKTVVSYAPEAVVNARTHSAANCFLLRSLSIPQPTPPGTPPFYLTSAGILQTTPTSTSGGWTRLATGGEENCTDAYTVSQAVYNSCLEEIKAKEKEVNDAVGAPQRLEVAQKALTELRLLQASVSQLPQKYADYYRKPLNTVPVDKRESFGYQALYDTQAKLQESIGKLEALIFHELGRKPVELVHKAKTIQETLPDAAVVERRLAETKLVRDTPRKDKTVVSYAPEAVVNARVRSAANCCLLRGLSIPQAMPPGIPPLYLTSAGILQTRPTSVSGGLLRSATGGEENCTDAYTVSQAVYNSCLEEIKTREKEVNDAVGTPQRLEAAQKALAELRLLQASVSQLPQKYADYYRKPLNTIPVDKRESFGYQALYDTQAKLQESIGKLEVLVHREFETNLVELAQKADEYVAKAEAIAAEISQATEQAAGRALMAFEGEIAQGKHEELHNLFSTIQALQAEAIGCQTQCSAVERSAALQDFHALSAEAGTHLSHAVRTLEYAKDRLIPLIKSADAPFEEGKRVHVDHFWAAANAVMAHSTGLVSHLETLERDRLARLVGAAQAISEELTEAQTHGSATPAKIAELQQKLNGVSLDLKRHFDAEQKGIFTQLEDQLAIMTESYNQLVQKRKELLASGVPSEDMRIQGLLSSEAQMQKCVLEFNSQFSRASLTTNAFTATKSHVMDYFAVVERRLYLCKEASECAPDRQPAILATLAQRPDDADMRVCADAITTELKLPQTQIVSVQEAKESHKKHPELAWGEPSLNHALCTPANWTTVRSACIKVSRAGKMHVAVLINEPLDIESPPGIASGGVPAGLRGDAHFIKRPANLMRTTSYISLGHGGQRVQEHISFRGGQFPTKEAAKKALVHIIREPCFQHSSYLHINALLTPTALPVVSDRHLLEQHTENIMVALDELLSEANERSGGVETEEIRRLQGLKKNLAVSNIGVNEGAVGQTKYVGVYLGWHTSVGYCIPASAQLNHAVFQKLEMMEHCVTNSPNLPSGPMAFQFGLLGPILQVGQELEAVYALNDYANATVGNNQFKMPALWKTLDVLIGAPCYTDCKSGKDRTGKVEGCSQEYLDEIDMNLVDQKQQLDEEFTRLTLSLVGSRRDAWLQAKDVLTSACFKTEELGEFRKFLDQNGEAAFIAHVSARLQRRVAIVREALGMAASPDGFMGKAPVEGTWFPVGTVGIQTTTPKMEVMGDVQHAFPKLAVSSMYPYMNPSQRDPGYERHLEDRQREAVNRRLSQVSGSLVITQMNTGKPGFKVEGGDPLTKHSAGFDLEFVLNKLAHTDARNPQFTALVVAWTGLDELSKEERQAYLSKIIGIAQENAPVEDKLPKWNEVLCEIAVLKDTSLVPKAAVKT